MEVTVDQVKAFRKKTGYGMMDCKKALLECNGNEDLAIEYLKRKPYRLVCGKMPASRTNDCMFCEEEVCENTYDSESMVCKSCLAKKCLGGN